ncbi:MAG TPA: hypothetical protein VKT80_16235 [Chloroflexota bacterium]|nr:hypothetical protein [Chloroflexota bacterium]
MCDGYRDDAEWTLYVRETGCPVLTPSGHSFVFSDEADARAFLDERADSDRLDVAPIPGPEQP